MAWVWIILAVLYIVSPYDLLPDFLPVRGWIDDLIVGFLLVRYVRRLRKSPYVHGAGGAGDGRWTGSGREKTQPEPPGEPHEILGVPPDAGPQEIRAAYRRLASRYHPDKVAHLGKEFQEMAEKRFKEIQNAYDRLIKE